MIKRRNRLSARRILVIGFASLAAVSSSAQSSTDARTASPPAYVTTIDVVKAHAGQRRTLVALYELNWARARATLVARGDLVSYRLLVARDTSNAWDIALETTYRDSTTHARAEELFAPVMRSQGLTKVQGKTSRDLGTIVESRILTVVSASAGAVRR